MHIILIVTSANTLKESTKTASDRKIMAIGDEAIPWHCQF